MNKEIKSYLYKHYRKSKNLISNDNFSYLLEKDSILVHFYDFSKNWGDYINRFLFEEISGKKVVSAKRVYNWKKKEVFFGVGSILQRNLSNSVIWGSGFVKPISRIENKPKKVLALRGVLSAEIFHDSNIELNKVYGDPALLFSEIYKPTLNSEFKLGVIPHYTEMNFFAKHYKFFIKNNINIINPLVSGNDHYQFIDEILKCENIVSSSLHGLIIADTYSIPSSRFVFEKNEIQGGDFKYSDYYSGVGIKDFNTIRINSSSPNNFLGLEQDAEKKILSFSPEILRDSLINHFLD